MGYLISGIQQVGVGVRDAESAFTWYRRHFGMDVPIFKDRATATLMTRYTGNQAHDRYAILALNMKGGGGLEIWQYTSREPQAPAAKPVLGDLGIFAVKLKVSDVEKAHQHVSSLSASQVSPVRKGPDGRKHFFTKDPDGNLFQLIENKNWFQQNGFPIGGVCGCIIGVNDMVKAIRFYQEVLGHKAVINDSEHVARDFEGLPGGERHVRRVVLARTDVGRGAFGELLGATEVELVEVKEPVTPIYKDRYWGDLGFIHVCFDVTGMNHLAQHCEQMGHPFTVDSRNSFDMGKAAGHFSYTEDNNGTLIEFVETHRVPILAKLGWYLDLRKREQAKPLPRWMVKAMGLNRVKD